MRRRVYLLRFEEPRHCQGILAHTLHTETIPGGRHVGSDGYDTGMPLKPPINTAGLAQVKKTDAWTEFRACARGHRPIQCTADAYGRRSILFNPLNTARLPGKWRAIVSQNQFSGRQHVERREHLRRRGRRYTACVTTRSCAGRTGTTPVSMPWPVTHPGSFKTFFRP